MPSIGVFFDGFSFFAFCTFGWNCWGDCWGWANNAGGTAIGADGWEGAILGNLGGVGNGLLYVDFFKLAL